MTFITIRLKENMMLNCCLQTRTVWFMKLKQMMFMKDLFDFSGYLQDSNFFDPVNKKVMGKMKDEFKRKIISDLVRLKSKMYSLIDVNNEENTKAKGVNKNVVKNIRHNEYIDVLFNKKNNKR